jgi:hypothetical protein
MERRTRIDSRINPPDATEMTEENTYAKMTDLTDELTTGQIDAWQARSIS